MILVQTVPLCRKNIPLDGEVVYIKPQHMTLQKPYYSHFMPGTTLGYHVNSFRIVSLQVYCTHKQNILKNSADEKLLKMVVRVALHFSLQNAALTTNFHFRVFQLCYKKVNILTLVQIFF